MSATRTPLSPVDTAWLHMESPTNHMVVTSVLLFDGTLDLDRLRRVYTQRLLTHERFRQRIVTPLRGLRTPHWELDGDFDLENHIHRVALPSPGGDGELQEFVADVMATPLDMSRPLWQAYIVDTRNGTAVVTRIHHCIADGIALIRVLLSLTDTVPDGDLTAMLPAWQVGESQQQHRGMAGAALHLSIRGLRTAVDLAVRPDRAVGMARTAVAGAAAFVRVSTLPTEATTPLRGRLGVRKRVAWSQPIPLAQVKATARLVDGTVNDVLMTAATGAMRRYLAQRGTDVEHLELHATVPVNLRGDVPDVALGNRFGLVYPVLPVGIADSLRRLRTVKRIMDGLKATPEAVMAIGVLGLLGRSPQAVERAAIDLFTSKSTTVLTNVPGPRQVHYLAGAPLRRILAWAPPSGSLSMSISILSYAGDVVVGFATDAHLAPDPEAMVAAFHDELDALAAAGIRREARRRVSPNGRARSRRGPAPTVAGRPRRSPSKRHPAPAAR
jgi:WS/DGAT/MGAT family acyltransferase